MIAGYHLIWTIYGWWLPNDPRGSTSHEIRAASIASLGELHYGRKRVQPAGRVIREFRDAARGVLKHPLLALSPPEIEAVGHAFAEVIRSRRLHLLRLRDSAGSRASSDPQTPRPGRNDDRSASGRQPDGRATMRIARGRPSRVGRSRLEGVSRNPRRHAAHGGLHSPKPGRQTSRPILALREALRRLAARTGADRSTPRQDRLTRMSPSRPLSEPAN